MSKPTGIFFCALFFLAGCATSPKIPEETISSPPSSAANAALNWADANTISKPAPPLQVKPPAPVVKINSPPPVVVSTAPAEPVKTWNSLSRWASQQKIGRPHLLAKTPLTTYAVSSLNGVMILAIGSLEAVWNGVEIRLGFTPQLIDGEIFVHGRDLQKNLEPLLCAPPLTFGTNRIIVIDPGHGGTNPGTKSAIDGRLEKEFTLDWARRLKTLLETNGWTVFMTRTNDTTVINQSRVVFAEAHHADLFISLHFNSTSDRNGRSGGLETYCITPTGMLSTITRGYADPQFENVPNNNFDTQNIQLAVRVQSALLPVAGLDDRGVRRSRFDTVLRGQNRPAILVEGGYLSNPAEATLIESAGYRQKMAEAMAAALK